MNYLKNICIFCSSSNNISEEYFKAANELASMLITHDVNLIYGGGMIGLMGELARVFYENNKKIVSIIPKKLNKDGIVFEDSDQIIETETMSERKSIMEKMSEAFIALPGGFGTLEEILEIITLKQLGYHEKPVTVLNTQGFYDPLLAQFENLYNEKFARDDNKRLYFVSKSPGEIIEFLKNYEPPEDLEPKLPSL